MSAVWEFLTTPLQYAFMTRGLVAVVLVGTVCAVVGSYMVLRGMAFFGDALAHAMLPGLAIGYLVHGSERGALFWWGMGTAILAALGIGNLSKGQRIRNDTAIGIVFAGLFALGVALISTVRSYTVDLSHFLFGDVLSVTNADLTRVAVFSVVVLVCVALFYKEFLVLSFDPILAQTLRLPRRLFEYLLLLLIAISVVIALQSVGVALMVALLITPAATASLLTKRLPVMMVSGAGIASLSGIVGLYLSYYLSIASGAAIVLTNTLVFVLIWLVKRG